MSEIKIRVEPETQLRGMDLVNEVLDPEITRFETWFSDVKRGNSTLTGMEKEILRTYLYAKLVGNL